MNIVIPAAGKGQRFKDSGYNLPKPLINVDGVPMLIAAIKTLDLDGRYFIILQQDEHFETISQLLKNEVDDVVIVPINFYTQGAACSVLLCKDYINNDTELFVANCDQIMSWNSKEAMGELRKYDGGIVTVHSDDPKHSYVQVDNSGCAVKMVEKQVISDLALTGLHYWKHGSDYVSSAEKAIQENTDVKEHYVSTTYNALIQGGKKIGIYMLDENEIHFIGTPNDLNKYESEQINRLHPRVDNWGF